jgi:hypothetical protein
LGNLSNLDNIVSICEENETESESGYILPKTRDICFDLNVDLADFYTGKRK